MAEMSPMMKQYLKVKDNNKNSIVFFRVGDFYEMFFDDAILASKELELTLTGKDCGLDERAPMCGIPHHSCEAYISRLVDKGYKVAICEQMEDPSTAKGIVKRDIIRVVTPGTVIEGSMLKEDENTYLCGLYFTKKNAGLCFADSSTCELNLCEVHGTNIETKILNQLSRFLPKEIVINSLASKNKMLMNFINKKLGCLVTILDDYIFENQYASNTVLSHFKAQKLQELSLDDKECGTASISAVLTYLTETQITGLQRINKISFYNDEEFMNLDIYSRRNLELLETMRSKEKKGSLLGVIDKTKTAMGKRLIKAWIERPLLNCVAISKRLNAVEELKNNNILLSELIEDLSGVFDLERLISRVVYGSCNCRELRAISQTLDKMPSIKNLLAQSNSQVLNNIALEIDTLDELRKLIDDSIVEEPPVTVKEGGIIKPGVSSELDDIKLVVTDSKSFLAKIEQREKDATGIKTLKIGYNRVFGYYIEVTNSFKNQVPADYIRKQTLTNAERYITPELKDLESKVLGAKEKSVALEYQIFEDIRSRTSDKLVDIQKTAHAIARLDVLCSFAKIAIDNNYVRPIVDMSGEIEIREGRHPVVEQLSDMPFVANDTCLNTGDNRVAIITGPNMAGKSTYMRQTAIIVIMAQIGCFVPASYAKIGVVDSIFTRVGASDDLASGQSTFMVEMNEVAYILKNATNKSLLILDEIGRGTSTFDGMSIAKSVLEYVTNKKLVGAKTMFATHYHELTSMEHDLEGIKNYNIAVKKHGDDITFLRRIIPGGADDSYGIAVAKLAGIPEKVISRANEILHEIESNNGRIVVTEHRNEMEQIGLLSEKEEALVSRIKAIDMNTITPMEAINVLYELTKLV